MNVASTFSPNWVKGAQVEGAVMGVVMSRR